MEFVHLHTHTWASPPLGFSEPRELFHLVLAHSAHAMALTDHGNLYAAPEFCRAAKEHEVKPIVGCEFRLSRAGDSGVSDWQRVILLSTNRPGYLNLVYLASGAHVFDYVSSPPLAERDLVGHIDGLVALFGWQHGHLQEFLRDAHIDGVRQRLQGLSKLFGPDHFYVELQAHGPDGVDDANATMAELAEAVRAPVVATASWDDSCQPSGASPDDIFAPDSPEVNNTLRIADMCEPNPLGHVRRRFFSSPTYSGVQSRRATRRSLTELLAKRLEAPPAPSLAARPRKMPSMADYEERLAQEVDSYSANDLGLLLDKTSRIVEWARNQGVLFAPAWDPALGSLAHYAMNISSLDPLLWDLPPATTSHNPSDTGPASILGSSYIHPDEVRAFANTLPGPGVSMGTLALWDPDFKIMFRAYLHNSGVCQEVREEACRVVPHGPNLIRHIPAMLRFVRESEDTDDMRRAYLAYRRAMLDWGDMHKDLGTDSLDLAVLERAVLNGIPTRQDASGNILSQYPSNGLRGLGHPCILWSRLDVLGSIAQAAHEMCMKLKVPENRFDLAKVPLDDPAVFDLFVEGDLTDIYRFGLESARTAVRRVAPRSIEQLAAFLAREELLTRGRPDCHLAPDDSREEKWRDDCPELLWPFVDGTAGRLLYHSQIANALLELAGMGPSEVREFMDFHHYDVRPSAATDMLVYKLSMTIKRHLGKGGTKGSAPISARQHTEPVARRLVSSLGSHLASRTRSLNDAILCYWSAYLEMRLR